MEIPCVQSVTDTIRVKDACSLSSLGKIFEFLNMDGSHCKILKMDTSCKSCDEKCTTSLVIRKHIANLIGKVSILQKMEFWLNDWWRVCPIIGEKIG